MALEQIQGKAGSLTPDELDRFALQYKPSWEIDDVVAAAAVVAVVNAPQTNGAHANGNGAASHAQAHAESADKPKVSPPIPAAAPRAAGIKSTVMGTGALAEAPPEVVTPAPPVEAEALAVEQPAVPAEDVEAAIEEEAVAPVAAAPEDAAPPADVTESKESADVVLGHAATIPATVVDLAGSSEAPIAVVTEQVASANENAEEVLQAKPVSIASIASNEAVHATRNEAAAAAEAPLDAIPMQGSSSGSIMKVVFALVAIVGIAFLAKGMLGGSEKDKPASTTNSQATTAPKETAAATPEQPATPPPEVPKTAEAATESPKPVKTETPKPAEPPKAVAKTAEPPAVEVPKPEVPKPVVTSTAATKATVAIAPKPPAPAPAPRPTTTATAKTGGGIIRETPF